MIALLRAKVDGLWTRAHIRNNVLAGVVVGVVALPLAMAFAIASGARPEQGLYTAIVAAVMTSLFGGTRLQISGPTGAFVAALAIITAQHGIAGLQVATLMAGMILLAFGFARLGAVIKYIPNPVIAGFTAGIGVIIFVGQWKDFFGLSPAATGPRFHEKILSLIEAWLTLNPATTCLGLIALAILILGARFLKRMTRAAGRAGGGYGGPGDRAIQRGGNDWLRLRRHPSFPAFLFVSVRDVHPVDFPDRPRVHQNRAARRDRVVAVGCGIRRHGGNSPRLESGTIGQGIANIAAPLFGGFAATGAIARTATNIRNGATSPLAGIVHSLFLIAVILLLAPLASAIPLCCLSAILFVVAWNMSEVRHFLRIVRGAPRPDVAILLLTFLLTVFVDLVVAVNVGVILAALLFMRRMSDSVSIEPHTGRPASESNAVAGAGAGASGAAGVVIYSIEGPFFFGAAEKLERSLQHIQRRTTTLVLRLGNVPFVDATGIFALEAILADFKRNGAAVLFTEVLG